MYQKLNKSSQIKCFLIAVSAALLTSCTNGHIGSGSGGGISIDFSDEGLAVGTVVHAQGRSALAPYQRWRLADQLASHILYSSPHLEGKVDSYEYVAKRVGEPFGSLVQSYRLEGDLSDRALSVFRDAELRRRYLMMVSISPLEESIELHPDASPVVGQMNREVKDYYDMRYQTIRLAEIRVQVYDTFSASKVSDQVYRSDDNGVSLARERNSRQYVGNSLLAALSNSASNGFKHSSNAYPPAPSNDDVMNYLWRGIASSLPGAVR